jgi:hypothetical protein
MAGRRMDTRRFAFRRRNSRFRARRGFHRRSPCGLLSAVKLARPVFGGRANLAQYVTFRLSRRARVRLTVRRGRRTVFRKAERPPYGDGRVHRLRVPAERRRRGTYRFVITARTPSGRKVRRTLVATRL